MNINNILIITFLQFVFLLSCSSNSYHEITFYDNGQKQYDIEYKNNKIDGLARYWDIDGNLVNEVNYVNNKFHGKWIDYYSNGNILHIINYHYGQKHGEEIWYYLSGNIKSKVLYEYDNVISNILRWNDKGKIINE